jgi:tripartite-type tricarboxylate transporter receptor subunit TctC
LEDVMKLNRRHFLNLAAVALAQPTRAFPQAWPDRPLRLIVPYAPGGPTDILARLMAPVLSEKLGQSVVVENVPGAGGNIGMVRGSKATPDGLTVTVVAPNVVINPLLYPSAGYDPFADFAPVTVAVRTAVVASVHPSLPVTTLQELIALVKSQPGRHSYASPGSGTPPHLVAEQLRMGLGLDLVHIPYSSAGQAVAAALAGQVPIVFSSTPPAIPHVAAGKLRGLAVTGSTRAAELANTPTMAESGHPEIDGEGWFAFMVPAATPKENVTTLYRALLHAMESAAVRARLPGLGFETVMSTPQASASRLKSEGQKWSRVIRTAGIKAD